MIGADTWQELVGDGEVARLLDDLSSLSMEQIDDVCRAWTEIPVQQREAAWALVRRLSRTTVRDEPLDAAFEARRAAQRVGRLAGLHDTWPFASAAWDAALALPLRDLLDEDSYRCLAAPMNRALPWLLREGAGPVARESLVRVPAAV